MGRRGAGRVEQFCVDLDAVLWVGEGLRGEGRGGEGRRGWTGGELFKEGGE